MRAASSRTRRRVFASLTPVLLVTVLLVLATCSRLSLPRVHFSLRLEWPEGRPHHHVSTSLPGSDHAVAGASQQSQRSQRRALAENSSAVPPPPPPVCECPACPAGDSGRGDSGPGGDDARSASGGGSSGAEGGGEAVAEAWGENHAFRVHPTSISLFAVVSTYRTGEARWGKARPGGASKRKMPGVGQQVRRGPGYADEMRISQALLIPPRLARSGVAGDSLLGAQLHLPLPPPPLPLSPPPSALSPLPLSPPPLSHPMCADGQLHGGGESLLAAQLHPPLPALPSPTPSLSPLSHPMCAAAAQLHGGG
ncbi:unnamed protein product [Closterium sp. Naga37s-1]|nr:unnamed protein product [Closterium sp. Naga37s-1]